MLYRIKNGITLSYQTMEQCKKEVLTEIKQEKQRFSWLQKWYEQEANTFPDETGKGGLKRGR